MGSGMHKVQCLTTIFVSGLLSGFLPIGGFLVDVRGPGGFAWNTSMTRNDTGDGACEIVWVETMETQ